MTTENRRVSFMLFSMFRRLTPPVRSFALALPFFLPQFAVCFTGPAVDPQALFDRVRLHVAKSFKDAPRYSCQQVINREFYDIRGGGRGCSVKDISWDINKTHTLARTDRLRFDVGLVEGHEVYSWHGGTAVATEQISDLVDSGPITSGTFYSFLVGIFLDARGSYHFRGSVDDGPNATALYDYVVKKSVSRYLLRTDTGERIVGYHGYFSVNPQTGDLRSLTVEVDDIPSEAHTCRLLLSFAFEEIRLGDSHFTRPERVTMTTFDMRGNMARVAMQYLHCREFVGESVIHFDDVTVAGAADAAVPRTIRPLPPGVQLTIQLRSKISLASAWAGDQVTGELAADAVGKHHQLLARKGAVVSGRLFRSEQEVSPEQAFVLGIEFNTLQGTDADYELHLEPRSSRYLAMQKMSVQGFGRRQMPSITTVLPTVGLYRFPKKDVELGPWFVTKWSNTKPKHP